MNLYPTTQTSIIKLLINTFKAYPLIFKQVWPLVLISSAAHLIIPLLFVLNPAFGGVAIIGFVLLTWFFYTAILYIANVAIEGGHMKFPAAYRIARQRFLAILASNLIFFAIGAFFFVVEYGLNLLFDLIHQHPLFILAAVAINVFIFIKLYFAIPLIALEHSPVFKSFERSVSLVKKHGWRAFISLGIVGLIILGLEAIAVLFTGTNRMYLFTICHFVIQMICYPLIISVTLMLLHDLKLRATKI